MGDKRKIMIRIVVGILTVFVIGAIVVKFHLSYKEHRAIQVAQEYLEKKYEQKMQYKNVRYSWIDPGLYHVYFISTDTGVDFEVKMWPKALDFTEGTTDYDGYLGDNYLSSFFCQKTVEAVHSNVKAVWDENVNISVVLHSSNVYPGKDISLLSENMTARDMEPFYNYEFFINTRRHLNNESKMEEAQHILNLFETIRKLNYHPVEIYVWYQTGKDDNNKVLTDSKTWSRMYIKFENWFEISNVEEIMKIMDEQWFSNIIADRCRGN